MSGFAFAVAAAAFCTATLSGIAGIGGGTVLIGIFYAVGLAPVVAVPLHAAVQLVSNASRTVAYLKHVQWRAALWFMAGAVPGPFLVAPLVAQADLNALSLLMAVIIGASLLPERKDAVAIPTWAAVLAAGVLNGSLGMFIGATGLVIGRLFLRPEWRKETVIGTLALTQMLGHGLRVAAFGVVGFSALAQPERLLPLCVAVIAGTALGKHFNGRIAQDQFDRIFKIILVVLSLKLLWDASRGLGWI